MVRHQGARDGSVPPSGRRAPAPHAGAGTVGAGAQRSHRRACGRSMEVAAAPGAVAAEWLHRGASSGGDGCVRSRRASGRARGLRALPPPHTLRPPPSWPLEGVRGAHACGDILTPSGTAFGLCGRAPTRALTSTHQPACVGAHAQHMHLLRSDATSAAATALRLPLRLPGSAPPHGSASGASARPGYPAGVRRARGCARSAQGVSRCARDRRSHARARVGVRALALANARPAHARARVGAATAAARSLRAQPPACGERGAEAAVAHARREGRARGEEGRGRERKGRGRLEAEPAESSSDEDGDDGT